jgi:hypothetical protein
MKLILAKLFVWGCTGLMIVYGAIALCGTVVMVYDTFPHGLYAIGCLIGGAVAWVVILLAFFKANDIINQNKKDN